MGAQRLQTGILMYVKYLVSGKKSSDAPVFAGFRVLADTGRWHYSWDPNSRVFVEITFCLILYLANNPPFLSMQAPPVPLYLPVGPFVFPAPGFYSCFPWPRGSTLNLSETYSVKGASSPFTPSSQRTGRDGCALFIAASSSLEKEPGAHPD